MALQLASPGIQVKEVDLTRGGVDATINVAAGVVGHACRPPPPSPPPPPLPPPRGRRAAKCSSEPQILQVMIWPFGKSDELAE